MSAASQLQAEVDRLTRLLAAETGVARAAERIVAELRVELEDRDRQIAALETQVLSLQPEGRAAIHKMYKNMWERSLAVYTAMRAEAETAHVLLAECRAKLAELDGSGAELDRNDEL